MRLKRKIKECETLDHLDIQNLEKNIHSGIRILAIYSEYSVTARGR